MYVQLSGFLLTRPIRARSEGMNDDFRTIAEAIEKGETTVGIEFGSTRIKAVLTDANNRPIASGNHDWENEFVNETWTYRLEDVWLGVQASYRSLVEHVREKYGVSLTSVRAIGISAMMHGYLAFDKNDNLLTPFRTWRNNFTEQASQELTALFGYPIPQRWNIAHLYQAMLNQEEHVSDIAFLTTLAGYVHWQLTGRKVLGIGDASGYFPIDLDTKNYNLRMIDLFNQKIKDRSLGWNLENILPEVLTAGEEAGRLTPAGARLLDPAGNLLPGVPLCPPEGDAGTGMVATNSIKVRTGNVSAGTSVFAMIVLEKELSKAYSEIDLVTTPAGKLVAMVHSNNCTSDYDAWINLFGEALNALGADVPKSKLYETLLTQALEGDADCGGLLSYGYVSGEHITHFAEGRPLFIRTPGSQFNLANFIRTHLFSALGALKIGLNILYKNESVQVDELRGHGGFFKTAEVGQRIMAAAANVPVSIMKTAGEGGAWGIAILASYLVNNLQSKSLEDYLEQDVFGDQDKKTRNPDPVDVEGFEIFMKRYVQGLPIEKAAVESL